MSVRIKGGLWPFSGQISGHFCAIYKNFKAATRILYKYQNNSPKIAQKCPGNVREMGWKKIEYISIHKLPGNGKKKTEKARKSPEMAKKKATKPPL